MRFTRVLLADDHILVRAGVRELIEAIDGVRVVAEADNGREAVALASSERPDIVIMDISMKELNGIDAAQRILAENPAVRVVILSMHTHENFVRRALRVGARGYLAKDSAPIELRMAVEAVMRDEVYLSSRISKAVVAGLVDGRADGNSEVDSLTPRQREILQLIAEGKSTKAIAFALGVSVKTVEGHRAALMERLDIHDVAGLVVFAVRNNLISLEGPEE